MKGPPPQGPGAVLRSAREAAGMSLQQVADTLRLSATVVRALEANSFEALPAPVYARGYVRTYAKLLALDADALLGEHDKCLRGAPPQLLANKRGRTPLKDLFHERLGWVFGGAVLVVGAVATSVVWWAWQEDPATASAAQLEAATSPSPASPPPMETERPPAPAPAAAEVGGVTAVLAEAAAVAAAEVASPVGVAALPGATGTLAFTFSEDCWVEVLDRAESPLHRDLRRAGDTLTLRGVAPFRIKLGNAPAVTLEYDGRVMALAPHTRNRVANLVLE